MWNAARDHLGSAVAASGRGLVRSLCASAARAPLLDGQVAIVTGSGQGIGESVARLFAREGAKVVVSDLDEARSNAVAASIRDAGGEAVSHPGDVTALDYGEKVVGRAVKEFGDLTIIVNNAGYTIDTVIHRMSDKAWADIMEVHTAAPFRIIRAAAPHFRVEDGKQRNIINISSTSGLHGNAGQVNYSTAKMGIVGLTKTIAKEWGRFNVRCNAVAFGMIDTRLTKDGKSTVEIKGNKVTIGLPEGMRDMSKQFIPLGRSGSADEAAGSVLLLASPYASYISGHCLECTGGAGI